MTDVQLIREISKLKEPARAGDITSLAVNLIAKRDQLNNEIETLKWLVQRLLKAEDE